MNRIAITFICFVSAFFRTLSGRACRFYPSCSMYAREAFSSFGFLKALKLTFKRLLRCHPLSRGGYDPLCHEERCCS